MNRLLVITDLFPPAFAPRVAYMCRLLQPRWEVTVVTEQTAATISSVAADDVEVIRLRQEGRERPGLRLLNLLGNQLFLTKDRWFRRRLTDVIEGRQFDAVVCFSYYLFPLPAARWIARSLGVPLVVDLRDIVEQIPRDTVRRKIYNCVRLKWLNRLRRNRILKEAALVTTVSPFHQEQLKRVNPNTHLIYNGYDEQMFMPQPVKVDRFRIVFAGRLKSAYYQGVYQRPDMLLDALERLDNDMLNHISCDWYVDDVSRLVLEQVLTHRSERIVSCCNIYAHQPYICMPRILNEASLVLVLTSPEVRGVLTTKLYEAIGVEKPVLCIRNDMGDMAQLIQQTGAGMAASTVEDIEHFVRQTYAEWMRNGYTHNPTNQTWRSLLTRRIGAEQLDALLRNVLRQHRRI
ncbi:MAG: glycosyltransferase [Paludibacteraceae bacterium]|nr:glycosyltransferase [Paludibacteraceae bacterium]